MLKSSHYALKAAVTVRETIREIKDESELRRMIATVACYPVEHPEAQGYEIVAEPAVFPGNKQHSFDVEIPVRIRNVDQLVESAICHRLMRGLETEEPYDEADALFDLMIQLGGGPLPEEMGLEFTLVGLEKVYTREGVLH